MSRPRPLLARAPAVALALTLAAAGCGHRGEDAGPGADGARAAVTRGTPAPAAPTTVRRTLRDGDVTDVDQLARTMATGTTGDPTWIDVFAHLRARSWLASRYPGRYDLATVYGDEAMATAQSNEHQDIALGVYLDEPLPRLVSVVRTRELGRLTELDVTLEAGAATVRGANDDQPRGVLPGGTHRGLFVVGQDGPGAIWRIHSVIELQVVDPTTGQEPRS